MEIEITPILDDNVNKDNILDECEKMFELYQMEKNRKKKLEEELKIEEKNEKDLLKKKRHMIQEKIIALKGNFRTYLNIKKDILLKKITCSPELFENQYEYFDNLCDDDTLLIHNLNDLEIMISDIYAENIIALSLKFYEKINTLSEKVIFSHNWSELDNEVNTGSYSVGYNK